MDIDKQLEQTFLALQEMHLHFTMKSVIKPPSEKDRGELVQLQDQAAEYQRVLKQIEVLWRVGEE